MEDKQPESSCNISSIVIIYHAEIDYIMTPSVLICICDLWLTSDVCKLLRKKVQLNEDSFLAHAFTISTRVGYTYI